jgi:hypothetical protein
VGYVGLGRGGLTPALEIQQADIINKTRAFVELFLSLLHSPISSILHLRPIITAPPPHPWPSSLILEILFALWSSDIQQHAVDLNPSCLVFLDSFLHHDQSGRSFLMLGRDDVDLVVNLLNRLAFMIPVDSRHTLDSQCAS